MTKGWKNEPFKHSLASRGIRTSFDEEKQLDEELDLTQKMNRATSYRNYRPDDFLEHALIDDETIHREKYIESRRAYNKMESGRYRDMMNEVANFFANLDSDEKEVWASENPELMRWLGIHGFLQVLKTFEDWTGIPSYHEFDMVKDGDEE